MGFERVGKIVDIDYRAPHAGFGQPVKRMVDERLACHPHQRLGLACGERAHPLAEPGGEHHCGVGGKRDAVHAVKAP